MVGLSDYKGCDMIDWGSSMNEIMRQDEDTLSGSELSSFEQNEVKSLEGILLPNAVPA